MDRGVWEATVHGVTKSYTQLCDSACTYTHYSFYNTIIHYYIMILLLLIDYKYDDGLPGKISITSDMQMTPPLWQKVKRNSKAC